MKEGLSEILESLQKDKSQLKNELNKSRSRREEYTKAKAHEQEMAEVSHYDHLIEEIAQKDKQIRNLERLVKLIEDEAENSLKGMDMDYENVAEIEKLEEELENSGIEIRELLGYENVEEMNELEEVVVEEMNKLEEKLENFTIRMGEKLDYENQEENFIEEQAEENVEKEEESVQIPEEDCGSIGKEGTGYAEGGFQPTVLKFPTLDLDIDKKTGTVEIESEKIENTYVTHMNASHYKRKALKNWREDILEKHNIEKEDAKYLKNVDPTIYNVYRKWDNVNAKKYGRSAAEMYVNSVMMRAKNLYYGHELEDVEMPGKINVDIGWHRGQDERLDDVKGFKPWNFLVSHRANKILRNHNEKSMNLATVKDNRLKKFGIGAGLATLLASVGIGTCVLGQRILQKEQSPKNMINGIEGEANLGHKNIVTPDNRKVVTPENGTMKGYKDKDTDKNQKQKDDTQKKAEANKGTKDKENKKQDRIYPGDLANMKRFTMVYHSSDAKEANGAIGDVNQAYGVNKMAVVIGNEIYTTDRYSADELYEMAKNNTDVSIRYHVDKAVKVDGKMYVETKEVGNPSPIYVYNDNGVMRTSNGRQWNGNVEHGIGWVDSKDLTKVKQQDKTVTQQKSRTQRTIQEREER